MKKTKQIYLDGVEAKNLHLILDYIYQGEVQIFQDDLDSFLTVAQKLKIEGLTGGDGETKEEVFQSNTEEIEDSIDPTNQETKVISQTVANLSSVIDRRRGIFYNYKGREAVAALLEQCEVGWKCKQCGKLASTKGNIELHAEAHVDGLSFDCSKCDESFSTRRKLNNHLPRHKLV